MSPDRVQHYLRLFMAKVFKAPNGCWLWTASCFPSGYGQFAMCHGEGGRTNHMAHRAGWILLRGDPGELLVCHNCPDGDNPLCVNPDHMFLGTQQDNMDDAVTKGKMAFPRDWKRVYSEDQRAEAKRLVAAGATKAEAAAAIGASTATIHAYIGKTGPRIARPSKVPVAARDVICCRVKGGASFADVANEYGCTEANIRAICNKAGMRFARRVSKETIIAARQLLDGGATYEQTAERLGVCVPTLVDHIGKAGRLGPRKGSKHKIPHGASAGIACRVANGECPKSIAQEYGCTEVSIRRIYRRSLRRKSGEVEEKTPC